jgi:hypothetical protein
MNGSSWARWWPLTGVAFVALWLVAFVVGPSGSTSDSDAKILSHLGSGDRHRQIATFFLILAAGFVFVWFLGGLRYRVQQAEGGPGMLTGLGFGAGLVAAGLWTVAGALFAAVAATADDTSKFHIDPNLWRLMNDLGYGVWFSGTTIAAALVATTALVALRTGLLPKWLAWLSFLVALTMLVAFFFIPVLIMLGWILVVSVTLILRPSATVSRAATMPG